MNEERGFNLLAEGFGLSREQRRLVLRVLWVLGVSTHIAWVCGLLAVIGFPTPFARAQDVQQLERATLVSARINLQQELRAQTRLLCSLDPVERPPVERTIDKLREEYRVVTKGEIYPEPHCP